MSENKPCPWCGGSPSSDGGLLVCASSGCPGSHYEIGHVTWNAPRHYEQEIERLRSGSSSVADELWLRRASPSAELQRAAKNAVIRLRALLAKGDATE